MTALRLIASEMEGLAVLQRLVQFIFGSLWGHNLIIQGCELTLQLNGTQERSHQKRTCLGGSGRRGRDRNREDGYTSVIARCVERAGVCFWAGPLVSAKDDNSKHHNTIPRWSPPCPIVSVHLGNIGLDLALVFNHEQMGSPVQWIGPV